MHGVGKRANRGAITNPLLIQADQKIHVPADIVIKYRDVAAGHIRDGHLVLILYELAENPTHGDHIVVRVRGETQGLLAAWQLAFAADLGAKHVKHEPIHRPWRAVAGH